MSAKTKAAELSSGRFDEAPVGASGKIPSLRLGLLLGLLLLRHDLMSLVCDEPTARSVLVAGFNLGPWALAPLPSGTMPQEAHTRNEKMEKILIFP